MTGWIRSRRFARGSTVVEFALVAMLVISVVLGIAELGRAFYKWNAAVAATRQGARTAAIVAMNDTTSILKDMRRVFPELTATDVSVEYSADGTFPAASCSVATCRFVRVGLHVTFQPLVFFLKPNLPMPPFYTTYPVEALGNAGTGSP